ncbi:hypothetical protein BH10ACT1_BH10ACT1_01500 [soil metagenome]
MSPVGGIGGEDRSGAPAWVAQVVDRAHEAAAAFDQAGTIVYANPAMYDLLGYAPGSLLGSTAFDLVHVDDLGRAAASTTGVGDGARPRPGQVHLRRADGSWALLEVSLSSIDLPVPPEGPGPVTAITIRDNWLQDAHWRFLSALTDGEPLDRSLSALAGALSHGNDGIMGVAYDERGERFVAGPLAPGLAGVAPDGTLDTTPGTPWADAMASGEPAWCPVESLPAPFRTSGEAVGAACVVVPVPDPPSDRPALLVQWPPVVAMAELLVEALVRRPRQAVMLALQRRETFDRLERLALQDPLTGLANRTHFFAVLDDLAVSGASYGVCYVDLDRFKAVNDALGHLAGDQVLVVCARRLQEAARPDEVVARLGGDEFAVACPAVGVEALEAVADRIVAALGAPVSLAGEPIAVGATVGCALAVGDPTDVVVARADAALYTAKRIARGTWSRADDVAAADRAAPPEDRVG